MFAVYSHVMLSQVLSRAGWWWCHCCRLPTVSRIWHWALYSSLPRGFISLSCKHVSIVLAWRSETKLVVDGASLLKLIPFRRLRMSPTQSWCELVRPLSFEVALRGNLAFLYSMEFVTATAMRVPCHDFVTLKVVVYLSPRWLLPLLYPALWCVLVTAWRPWQCCVSAPCLVFVQQL